MKRLLVVLVALSGCATSKADALTLDLTATKAAYGMSVNALRAFATVTVEPGVLIEKQHQVTVTAETTAPRADLASLLDRLATQSPADAFVLEGEPPTTPDGLMAQCRALLVRADARPCALEVHTAHVRYRVEISRTLELYTATFHALGRT